ncbi:TWiK family of potassium channels protein 18-like isoform X1 [Cimex lectularius]|uniref:Potassium channel domain-containing protein n=1 Tax=Cimex lectularius TaxID=79782 RepID=A0A8I6RBZ3_CIMLE|nr:TWiK family of potassium channels protein 18-like isoform X1 [Cimex lectularius]XP_014241737.1 TWiK family of potassium channels protein 18-like isoform X1 [Cimex lectularius]
MAHKKKRVHDEVSSHSEEEVHAPKHHPQHHQQHHHHHSKKAQEDIVADIQHYGLEVNERIFLWLHAKVGQLSQTWVTHGMLLVAVVLYAFAGAFLFRLCEANDKPIEIKDLFESRPELVQVIMSEQSKFTSSANTPKTVEYFFGNVTKGFQDYELAISANYNHNIVMARGKDELNWEFWNTVFFCCTVFTSIGYGHMYPVTTIGRLLTMVYAVIGIPLFLIVLTDFGFVLTRVIKFLWLIFRRIYYTGSFRKEDDEIERRTSTASDELEMGVEDDEIRIDDDENAPLPVTLCLMFFALYIFLGSILFFLWEDWTFFEAFYFLFISMTTLGLGDFVPKNQDNMMISVVFMGFGLSLSSMCINVVRERLVESMIEASSKIGEKYGIEIEIDKDLIEDPGMEKKEKNDNDT